MKSLFSIFEEKKNESSTMRGAAAAMIVESANTVLKGIFGVNSSAFAEAIYAKNGVLGIKAGGSGAASEIRLREGEIVDKINEKFDGRAVQKIKLLS